MMYMIRGSLLLMQIYEPSVAISQRLTPYAHTSEAVVNSRLMIDSIAIHFHGRRPLLVFT